MRITTDIKTALLYRKAIRQKRNQIRLTNQKILKLLIEYDRLPYIGQTEHKEKILELKRDLYDELEEYEGDLDQYREDFEKWYSDLEINNTIKNVSRSREEDEY